MGFRKYVGLVIVLMASMVMADSFCPKEKTVGDCPEDGYGDGQQGCTDIDGGDFG